VKTITFNKEATQKYFLRNPNTVYRK